MNEFLGFLLIGEIDVEDNSREDEESSSGDLSGHIRFGEGISYQENSNKDI